MRAILFVPLFALLPFSSGFPQNADSDVADRLRMLESSVASLETLLDIRTTSGAGSLDTSEAGLGAQRRIDNLERQVRELTRQMATIQRQVDQAGRDAAAAAREAAAARRDARDALMRAR